MSSAIDLLTGLTAFALSIYIIVEYIDVLSSRCCYSMKPLIKHKLNKEKLIWSRGLASLATNPRELWRTSLVKAAKEIQALTNVELVVSGDLMKSLSLHSKLSLITRLIRKLGVRKGLKTYSLFNRLLKSYPNSLNEALISSSEVNQLIKMIRDVRG